jgi:hypothetical protein
MFILQMSNEPHGGFHWRNRERYSAIADLLKWARLGFLTQDVKDVLSRKLAINLI